MSNFFGSSNTQVKDFEVQQNFVNEPISCIKWSTNPQYDICAVGSWDKNLYFWNVQKQVNESNETAQFKADPIGKQTHNAPVLSAAFSKDGLLFSGSCDGVIKATKVGQQGSQDIGKHDGAVKSMDYIDALNLLYTGSWDKSIRYWDIRQKTCALTVNAGERVYASSVRDNLLIVGTADRQISIFDLTKPKDPVKKMESPLKYQTKTISLFHDKKGFGMGSIEGRVHLGFFEEKHRDFAFKCHRTPINNNQNNNEVYSINSLDFHPVLGSFATAGSDGAFHFWDKESKTRLLRNPNFNQPISAAGFNKDGTIYSYCLSYDFSKGITDFYQPNQKTTICFHYPKKENIKPGEKKK